jgi:hypothetical protein
MKMKKKAANRATTIPRLLGDYNERSKRNKRFARLAREKTWNFHYEDR